MFLFENCELAKILILIKENKSISVALVTGDSNWNDAKELIYFLVRSNYERYNEQ